MNLKDIIEKKEDNLEKTPLYVPSSSEKKRAILMYLLVGIMVYLSKKEVNEFEYYHLKQSIWWWILFLLILVMSAVLLFVPIIRIIWILLLLMFLVVWWLWIKQARDGKYWDSSVASFMNLFSWVWNWFLELFDVGIKTIWDSQHQKSYSDNKKDEQDISLDNSWTDVEWDSKKKIFIPEKILQWV